MARTPEAIFRLGVMYENGNGVTADVGKAMICYKASTMPQAMERLEA